MDLSNLLRSTDAHVRLDLVSPPPPRLGDAPLVVPPGSLHPTLATTAFSHLLRFELERRHPRARRQAWPAEAAPERLGRLAPELSVRAEMALAEARHDLARYLQDPNPGLTMRETMAMHALRVGRLDAVVRAGYVDAALGGAERDEDIEELLAMLDAVPWDAIGGASALSLDHAFERFADVSPVAGAELVSDGLLLAIRTTKGARLDADDLRELMFRLILARADHAADPAAPDVREVGVYFARHGLLWREPVDPLAQAEAFPKVEAWFLHRLDRAQRMLARARENAREGETPRPGLAKTPKWVKKKARADRSPPASHAGKAEVKKAKDPAAQPPRPPKPSAPRSNASQDAQGEAQGRTKTPRPDWRKGSAWRRERGR